MLVGHLAAGLAAKRVDHSVPLGIVVFAALLPDFLWAAFLLAGIEHIELRPGRGAANYIASAEIGISHSLLADLAWAALFAGAWWAFRRWRRESWILFALVLSHWVLDFISNPWAPLAPGMPSPGLALWSSLPATLAVEGGMWIAAIVLYVRATQPVGRAGLYGFWIVAALLTERWYANITGPPPPSQMVAGLGGLVFFSLIVAWAVWMNRARRAVL